MIRRQAEFSLTRYFTATSAVVILLAALGVSLIFSRLARQQMIEESEDDAVSLAGELEQLIKPTFIALLASDGNSDDAVLRRDLKSQLQLYHERWDVFLVVLHDAEGNAIFSDAVENHQSPSDRRGIEKALGGQVWSEFETGAQHLQAYFSRPVPDHLVETYAPIYSPDGQEVIGVLELYRDVRTDYERAIRVQFTALAAVVAALAGLFTVLALIVRYGDHLLKQTGSRFSNILATSSDAIICTDGSGRITLWNEAATRLFGYTSEEMLGQSYQGLVAPEARHRLPLPDLKPVKRTRRAPIVSTAVRRDGTAIPVEISVSTYRSDSVLEYSAVIRDITKRQKAELEIGRRIEELTILSAVAAAVNRAPDLSQVLTSAVNELERALGLPYAEVWLMEKEAGELRPFMRYGFPDDASVTGFVIREGLPGIVAETGHISLMQDMVSDPYFVDETGERHHLQTALGIPLMAQDQLVGVLNLFSDDPTRFTPGIISALTTVGNLVGTAVERARLYESTIEQADELSSLNQALKDHATMLEERVAERTAELQVALKKAQESDRLKSEFVSNINHEMRTPLSSIKLAFDLLSRLPPDRWDEYLEMVRREMERLEHLINDLLHLSRLDLQKAEPQMVEVDINALLSTLTGDRAALIESRRLSLEVSWAKELPKAWADPAMVTQVATNLLTNAMNYTPPGGTIKVRTAPRMIGGERWVSFSVSDTGHGIHPEDLPHLFERFYRGRVGKTTSAPGTGLGLAIVKEILGLHNGGIEVRSEPERGTTFVVWIPSVGVGGCGKGAGSDGHQQMARASSAATG